MPGIASQLRITSLRRWRRRARSAHHAIGITHCTEEEKEMVDPIAISFDTAIAPSGAGTVTEEPPPTQPMTLPSATLIDQGRRLVELRDGGALTEEQYMEARARLLS
jgi:hypothetical protein